MGVMDILFGNRGAEAAPQQQQQTQQQQPAQPASISAPGNPNVPSGTPLPAPGVQPAAATPGTTQADQSPLANFAELWQPNKQQPGTEPAGNTSLFQLDEAKLQQSVRTLDFTKAIDPEMSAKALGGDAQALAQVINSVAQASMAQNALLTTKLVESAVAKTREEFSSKLPQQFRNFASQEALHASNPAFSDPALAPLVNLVNGVMQQKFPTASSAELTRMTQEYLSGAASTIAGKPQAGTPGAAAENAPPEEDWSKFLQGVQL